MMDMYRYRLGAKKSYVQLALAFMLMSIPTCQEKFTYYIRQIFPQARNIHAHIALGELSLIKYTKYAKVHTWP